MSEIRVMTQNQKGFSLVELLVAVGMGSLLMALIVSTYYGQTRSSSMQQQVMGMQQNLRTATFLMEREIMMAGYEPDPTTNAGAGIITATSTVFAFSFVDPVTQMDGIDNDGDGTVDEALEKDGVNNDCDADGETDESNELETVQYRLYDALSDGDMDLGRELLCPNGVVRAAISAIIEDVEAIEFFYTLADGTRTSNPAAGNLQNIRTVGISILARTTFPVKGYVDDVTYTPLSGGVWGVYNDQFRRQLITATVLCRNM